MVNPFYFSDGSSASTTRELESILENGELQEFTTHVVEGHFASWIRHELGNDKLADRLEQCRSVQQVLDVLHLEHTPKPKPKTEVTPVLEPQREPIRDLGRTPISDLTPEKIQRPVPEPKPEPVVETSSPKIPQPVPKQGVLERYNAKEFVIGLVIGVILGGLIFALVGALG